MAMMCSINGPQSSATANRNTRVSRSTAWRGLDQSRIRSSAFPELIYDAACLHDDIPSDPSGLKGSGCWEAAPHFPSLTDGPEEFFPERNFRSEEHTSELQSLMRISYAVFCLKKKKIPRYS